VPHHVYLDNAATTPLRAEALDAMLPYLEARFGNPSGLYALGREAQDAIDGARASVASVLDVRPGEVLFTSGGTESVNAALFGGAIAQKLAGAGDQIIVSAIEHHAVLHTCHLLEKLGFEVSYLPVDRHGVVETEALERELGERTALVSVMAANNETGTLQPTEGIAGVVAAAGRRLGKHIVLHSDAVQAAGWLDLKDLCRQVDTLSLSAHKFGGPKGSGVLYLRRATPFLPLLQGGGQERQKRAGTENVAGIVGTGVALTLAQGERREASARVSALRDRLQAGILSALPDARVNGHPGARLPGHLNVSFPGTESDSTLAALDAAGVAASSGSACSSSTWEPSHVLLAMGVPIHDAVAAVRFSLGHDSRDSDIDHVLEVLPTALSLTPGAHALA
jgi:cysteine desulfurase